MPSKIKSAKQPQTLAKHHAFNDFPISQFGGDIVGNIITIIGQLGDGELVGLIAVGIILYLINKRPA